MSERAAPPTVYRIPSRVITTFWIGVLGVSLIGAVLSLVLLTRGAAATALATAGISFACLLMVGVPSVRTVREVRIFADRVEADPILGRTRVMPWDSIITARAITESRFRSGDDALELATAEERLVVRARIRGFDILLSDVATHVTNLVDARPRRAARR